MCIFRNGGAPQRQRESDYYFACARAHLVIVLRMRESEVKSSVRLVFLFPRAREEDCKRVFFFFFGNVF